MMMCTIDVTIMGMNMIVMIMSIITIMIRIITITMIMICLILIPPDSPFFQAQLSRHAQQWVDASRVEEHLHFRLCQWV